MSTPRPDRPFLPSWLRWHEWLSALGLWLNGPRWERGYVVLLLGLVLGYQLASPIVLGDTDMWYHLNGGRYFWEHGAPANNPFFSFNEPERIWVNYYWGFQAIVYKVHELTGYQGLVVLRSLLVLASLLAIWAVIAGFRRKETSGLALLVLLALFVILVDGRAYQLRPHLFSYAFIPFFIYVLEHRPRWVILLPVATVAWVNVHGVEWVVGALIGGAYLLEFAIDRKQGRYDNRSKWFAIWLVACLPALLANPHGFSVLTASFAHPPDISQYINEMRPLSGEALFTIATQSGQLGAQSAFALLFVFSIYSVAASLFGHRARIAHLLLLAGGLILLSRGTRFIWEWALLALPLLAAQAGMARGQAQPAHGISPSRAAGLALLVMPALSLAARMDLTRPYPFNPEGLPQGISSFLRGMKSTGHLLLSPSLGGYAQWELGPEIRIFGDMELPPFTDWDMFRVFSAYRNVEAFKRLLKEHPIDFFFVETRQQPIAGFLKDSGEYLPVFFDDAGVLYAHRERQAALVQEHELKTINPYNLLDGKNPLDERMAELEKVLSLYPHGNRVLHALTRGLVDAKRYADAEKWADLFLERQPRDPNSHLLKGVILENTDRCREAIGHFERAFPLSSKDFHPALHQHIGSCHYLTKNFGAAYDHFERGVNMYLRGEPSETLYQYAFSSVIAGDISKAKMLLRALLFQTPDKETHLIDRARGLLQQIESDPPVGSGIVGGMAQ